jgi:hypothetical protein
MSGFDVRLSSSGIKNIRAADIQQDFVFIVGCERYVCPRILADFLSQKVSQLHLVESPITEYVVEIEDLNQQLSLFLSLGQGSSIHLDEINSPFFLSLS